VCDHGDALHRVTSGRALTGRDAADGSTSAVARSRRAVIAASHARAAASAISSAQMPIRAPARMSVRWCIPRYIRDRATIVGSTTASVQTVMPTQRARNRDEITSASAPYTAIDAAMWPDG